MTAAPSVLAVLITKADSSYCERTLRSLFAQSVPPSRVLVGVVGADASPIRSLCDAMNLPFPCHVHSVGEAATFFEAVNFVCSENASDTFESESSADASHGEAREEWLWLLHDDSAPEAHCLEALIESTQTEENAETDTTVGIVGTKQVAWDNPDKLLEVGIRATRSARRVPYIGNVEYDQGQYDYRQEVLAVGSAGMLIRRSALDEIGGFEEKLGPFGDGLELSRRMRASGYTVLICPQAKVRHAQQSLGEKPRDSFAKRRKAQIFNALVGAPSLVFPFLFLFYLLAAFPRALARLLTGKLRLAGAELRAPFAALGALPALLRSRRRLKKASRASNISRRHAVSAHEDSPRAIRTAQLARRSANRDAADMKDVLDPLSEKELRQNRQSTRTYAWVILALTALAAFLAHGLRLSLQAGGGALLPDSSSFSQSLRTAASSWLASGDGYAVPSDSFWAFLAPFSLLTSQLGIVATWIIFLGIIGAAVSAYIAAGDITNSPPRRAIGALIWAFAPPLLDSVNAGHVAGVLVHILAPLALMAFMRAWAGSASALAASALLCAFLASASPIILLLTIIAAIVGFIRHGGQRARWLALPIPALVMLAPTLFALVRLAVFPPNSSTLALSAPWRFLFSTPGAPLDTQAEPVSLLSFSPLSSVTFSQLSSFDMGALVRVLPIAVLLVLAVVALMRPSRYRAIRLGWIFIAFGWAWALLASHVNVGVLATPGAYTLTRGWTGIALAFAFLGVWIVLLNMTGTSPKDSEKTRSFARTLTRVGLNSAAFVSLAASLIFGGLWVSDSFTGSASMLSPVTEQAPALALADEASSRHSRVLAIKANEEGLELELWRGDGIELHETSMLSSLIRTDMVSKAQTDGRTKTKKAQPYGTRANEDLANALASLTTDASTVPEVLADHGISVVLVPEDANDSATRTLIGRLNSVRGLEYITTNETGSFWRVRADGGSSAVSRLRLEIGDDDAVSVTVPSGVFGTRTSFDSLLERAQKKSKQTTMPKQGRLVLAERADPYWHAELVSETGTRELKARGGSWAQQWDIPLDVKGADIVVYYASPIQRAWPYVQLAVMVLTVIGMLALPKKKRGRYG